MNNDGMDKNAHRPIPRLKRIPRRALGRQRPTSTVSRDPQADLAETGVVDCALYEDGRRAPGDLAVGDAYEALHSSSNGFVWVGLHEPSKAAFARTAEEFSLHPLAVEDAIHAHQRTKLEVYGDTIFIVLKTVRYIDSQEVIRTGEVMLFLGRNFIVTVRHGEGSELKTVRKQLEDRQDLLQAGPAGVLYAIADYIVDDYSVALTSLSTDVDEVEAAVFDPDMAGPTQRIYMLKREVMEFRRAVAPLADALATLTTTTTSLIDEPMKPYLRDVYDHVARDAERITIIDQMLSDVLQANVAQVTLRQNEDVRKITAVAAILATLTTIAGIYGMNFENMPELKWEYGYFIVLGVMAAASAGLYTVFRHKKWL